MITLSFEREDIYNLDFSELDIPDIKLTKTKRAHLLSSLFLYRDIVLSEYASELETSEESIKQYIQLLIQALIIRGYYRKNRFIVASVYRHPEISSGRLTTLRKNILGTLIGSPKIKISHLSKILNISKKDIVGHLLFLTSKGLLIGNLRQEELTTVWIWNPEDKVKITANDTFIIGTCMMLRNANLEEVAKYTEFSREEIFEKIANLMLHRKLEASITIGPKVLGKSNILVNVRKYLISPKILPLSSLQGDERDIVGYTLIKKRISIQELAKLTEKKPIEIVRILAFLTARGTFQFVFAQPNILVPVVVPELTPKRTIEEMATLSFFNYEALFGLLSTQSRITLKKLAALMNRTDDEITEGIITLVLEGFVSCTLKGNVLSLDKIKRYSRAQEGTLDRWEKIVLGMIIAKTTITVKDISLALGIDKYFAKEKLYAFYGKGLIKGTISGSRLIPDEIPIFPPLVQLDDLPVHFQEIFGFLVGNDKASIKNIQSIWEKTPVAARNIIYEITGSGLAHIELNGGKIGLISHQKILPSKELEDMGETYVKLVNEIEKSRRRRTRISNIADKISLAEHDAFKMICQLIANGYYKGNLTATFFERVGRLSLPSKKMHCLNCGHVITSVHQSCGNCGQYPQKCIICQGLVKRGDNILECPNCNNLAHKDHMLQWLKIKEECPICKTKATRRTLKAYAT